MKSKKPTLILIIALFIFISVESKDNEPKKLPDAIRNIDKKRIVDPVSSMMPEYPEKAYEANVNAEVWTRFKIDSLIGIYIVEVIYSSVDSFGFEEAAINWMMTGHFRIEPKTKINADD